MPLAEPVPDLVSLDLLLSVSERGSISAAAAVHGMSQPAASMRLSALERALGLQLLERSVGGSRLTAAGEATVEWAAAVLAGVAELVAGAAALRGEERSHLRVAASMTVAEYLFPGWLARLTARDAAVRVALEMGNSADVARRVRAADVDLGFVEGPMAPRGLAARAVLADRLVVIVSPAHPWARRRRPISPAQLAGTPLVVREVGSGTRAVLDAALATHGLEPEVAAVLGSTTAIKTAVVAGTGPAVVSALALGRELASGQVVEVTCRGLATDRWIHAVWPKGRQLSEPAAALVAIAQASGRGHPGD